jgi:hypothetical protein
MDRKAPGGPSVSATLKIPEHFVRPNVQSGLFLKLPVGTNTTDASVVFTQLNFRQYPLDAANRLLTQVGEIMAYDGVASWAKIQDESSEMPVYEQLRPLELTQEPAELKAFGQRLFQPAGFITDDLQAAFLGELLAEIVNISTTGVRRFTDSVRVIGPQTQKAL